MAEDAKVAVRNVRRDAMDKFKAAKKAGELTEDDQKKLEEKMQKITDKFIKEIDEVAAKKTKEVMEL
jgi:ribosome recycling factor